MSGPEGQARAAATAAAEVEPHLRGRGRGACAASGPRSSPQVLEAEERERARVAQALHDDALQSLLAAHQDLIEAAPGRAQVTRAHEIMGVAIDRVRDAVTALHPVILEQRGLEAGARGRLRPGRAPGRVRLGAPRRARGALGPPTASSSRSPASWSPTPPATRGPSICPVDVAAGDGSGSCRSCRRRPRDPAGPPRRGARRGPRRPGLDRPAPGRDRRRPRGRRAADGGGTTAPHDPDG